MTGPYSPQTAKLRVGGLIRPLLLQLTASRGNVVAAIFPNKGRTGEGCVILFIAASSFWTATAKIFMSVLKSA